MLRYANIFKPTITWYTYVYQDKTTLRHNTIFTYIDRYPASRPAGTDDQSCQTLELRDQVQKLSSHGSGHIGEI